MLSVLSKYVEGTTEKGRRRNHRVDEEEVVLDVTNRRSRDGAKGDDTKGERHPNKEHGLPLITSGRSQSSVLKLRTRTVGFLKEEMLNEHMYEQSWGDLDDGGDS